MKYRLLKVGDFIKVGDQQSDDRETWTDVCVGDYSIGDSPAEYNIWKFRRPIKSTSRTSPNTRFDKIAAWVKHLWQRLRKARNVVPQIILDPCAWFDGGVCCNPQVDAGEVGPVYYKKCPDYVPDFSMDKPEAST